MRVLSEGKSTGRTDLRMVALSEIYDLDHHRPADHDVVGLQVQMHDSIQLQVTDALGQHEEDVYLGTKGEAEFLRENVLNEIRQEHKVRKQVILQHILLSRYIILRNEQRISTLNLFEYILLMLYPILILPALDNRQSFLPLDDHHLPDHLLSSETFIINRGDYLVVVT